jgi:putative FmdB family regulatory protein
MTSTLHHFRVQEVGLYMPTYVYKNITTGQTFEIQQRMTEDALTHDPATGDPVKRIISAPSISFKGSGFYVNDSRGKSSGSSQSQKSTSSESSKSESAPVTPAKSSSSDKGAS